MVALLTLTVGFGLTVTVEVLLAEHPPLLATMVYTVFAVGVTVMLWLFEPLLHVYPAAAPAVSVAVCPLHTVAEFTLMVPEGLTTTVAAMAEVQLPLAPVTV
jgi:4-amino-4-deoxy-L-arabinose transferase-like glycosyltransferase